MKKISSIVSVFLSLILFQTFPPEPACAEVEWSIIQQLDLEQSPLDVTVTPDGATIYILAPGEVLIYTLSEDQITSRIPVERSFDRITYSPQDNSLILSSVLDRIIQIIHIEPIHDIDIEGLPFLGAEDAPVTIAVFNDYQWPHCVRLVPLLQQVLEENEGNVKIVFKQFPLAMHKMARKAAAASLAAKEQDKFWEYHDMLLANISSLSDAKLQEIAESVGLDMEKFNEDLTDASIQNAINSDVRNGQQSGVRGTPTVFINGKRVKSRSRQSFQEMIDAELKKVSEESTAK